MQGKEIMFTGKDIRRLRKVSGMSQVDLAKKLGVHHSLVSRMETGRLGISKRTETQLKSIFRIDDNATTNIGSVSSN